MQQLLAKTWESEGYRFKSCFCHFLAVWTWVSNSPWGSVFSPVKWEWSQSLPFMVADWEIHSQVQYLSPNGRCKPLGREPAGCWPEEPPQKPEPSQKTRPGPALLSALKAIPTGASSCQAGDRDACALRPDSTLIAGLARQSYQSRQQDTEWASPGRREQSCIQLRFN